MQDVNLSLCPPPWLMPIYKHKCAGTLLPARPPPSVGTEWYMGDEWSGKCIFHPVPLCLCSPYTHYTTGNTCNASCRDFWQRGGGNNFRTPRFLSSLPPLSLHPPNSAARPSYVSHRSGGWRQLISSPWHAMMERRALNPSTYSRPRAPARLRQRGSVLDAWRVYWSATGGQPERRWRHSPLAVSSFPWASSDERRSVSIFQILTLSPLSYTLRFDPALTENYITLMLFCCSNIHLSVFHVLRFQIIQSDHILKTK